MAYRGVLMLLLFAAALPAQAGKPTIPAAYHHIAREERVPAESLYSLALTESARKTKQGVRPWPWTLNVAGRGYRYASREEAMQGLLQHMRRHSTKRIDVGLAQVNLGWNGHRFSSLQEAFEPYTNLRVAARILRECYDANPGSWLRAAGCYHHPAGGKPAAVYIASFKRQLNTFSYTPAVRDGLSLASQSLTWIEPQ